MKKVIAPLIGCACILFLANWGSEETSVEGTKKPSVDFYGTLTTQADRVEQVENITIGRRYNKIPLYESPALNQAHAQSKDAKKKREKTAQLQENLSLAANEKPLLENPLDGIITRIDLSEVGEIRVTNPELVWVYQKRKGSRKVEYIEITVVSNDAAKTENTYLIDVRRKMTCDVSNDAGPIEQDVPFKSIKSLAVKGYRYRDEEAEKRLKKTSNKPNKAKAKAANALLEEKEDGAAA